MNRTEAFKLLSDIDRVEADLRGLESRLTSIRVRIRRDVLLDRDADYVPESEQKLKQ